jgi:pyruvate formate-lyase activating enzyme-like uncharacterized protein
MNRPGPKGSPYIDTVPETIRHIRTQAEAFRRHEQGRTETAAAWKAQVAGIREAAPSAQVEDGGETIRFGPLSPGCMACKAGRWDCVFVTNRCNLDCSFCLRPTAAPAVSMHSAFGKDLEQVLTRYADAGMAGVSFSGGEPLLEAESILAWLRSIRANLPGIYLWAYTNGLMLSSSLLERLAEAGLDELRFNMAAVGFQHPAVDRLLREAAARLPAVAIEIPALPAEAPRILARLEEWAAAGVKYLNLHELIYEPGTSSAALEGLRVPRVMPDGHFCEVDPRSPDLVCMIVEQAAMREIPLSINYCSLQNKWRQLRGRRRVLAPFVLRAHERLLPDGSAESACVFDAGQVEWVHPTLLDETLGAHAGRPAALVRRLLPLGLEQQGQWTDFEMVEAGDTVG